MKKDKKNSEETGSTDLFSVFEEPTKPKKRKFTAPVEEEIQDIQPNELIQEKKKKKKNQI